MIEVNKDWSLLLDRDGVINVKLEEDYVKTWGEFVFLPKVIESLKIYRQIFGRIIIFTNQQGIGKGLMTEDDLNTIHYNMVSQLTENGVSIDGIYYCPHLKSDDCVCRKPRKGLAVSASDYFEDIDYKKSIMVGDSIGDMEFGKGIKATTVMVSKEEMDHVFIDYNIKSLSALQNIIEVVK